MSLRLGRHGILRLLLWVVAAVAAISCSGEPGRSVAPGHYFFEVAPVEAGELLVELLPNSGTPGEVTAEVWLRRDETPADEPPNCTASWASAEEVMRRDCRIAVDPGEAHGWLEVRVSGPEETNLRIVSPQLTRASPPRKPQVFVLVLDALRADTFSAILELRDESTELLGFVSDSILFENARAPSSWTRPSTASLLTGLSPQRHGVEADFAVLPRALQTLPEILKAYGYRTYGWSTNPSVLPQWGFAQGFDVFVDVDSLLYTTEKPDAAVVFERVEHSLEEEAHGFGELFYIHLIDPHVPYESEVSLRREIRGDLRLGGLFPGRESSVRGRRLRRARSQYTGYLSEIVDLHQKLGGFFDHLRQIGAYRSALILLVSDHGEEFLEHGRLSHGVSLYEEVLRVPLVLKLPGNRRAGERIDEMVTLEDLVPTLLHALDLPVPPGLDGRDVLSIPIPAARPYVGSLALRGRNLRSLRSGPWKLIVDDKGRRELYDLEDDPGESSDLAVALPEKVQQLQRQLELRLDQGQRGWHLLGCGGTGLGTLAFSIRNWNGEIREHHLESDDMTDAGLDLDRETLEVVMNVDYESARIHPDDDEIVLEPPATDRSPRPLSIGSSDGKPLPLLLGAQQRISNVPDITLDQNDASIRLDPLDRPNCIDAKWNVGGGSHPTLRIWYSPPASTLSPEQVSPSVAERLRALGYLERPDGSGEAHGKH